MFGHLKMLQIFIRLLQRIQWYGVQKNRVDKGSEDSKKLQQSPKSKYGEFSLDYSKGFGGKYGVQTDRVDKVRNKRALY